jgi:anti-anti-sigma factor
VKPFVLSISRTITHKQHPGEIDPTQARAVLRQLDGWIKDVHRPRVVLNCSELDEMGLAEIRFLVSCLERVMKRNGDARLASVSAKGRETLAFTGAGRLFRIYDSIESAMKSFDSHSYFDGQGEYRAGGSRQSAGEGDGSTSPSLVRNCNGRKLGDANE